MEPKKGKKIYLRWGLTLLCVVVASIIVSVIFTNFRGFFDVVRGAIRIVSPLLYGALFSYLLNPLVKLVDGFLVPRLKKKLKKPERAAKLSRVLGIIFALIIMCFLIFGFFYLVLPQLYETIVSIGNNLPSYFRTCEKWALKLLADHPELRDTVNAAIQTVYNSFSTWLSESLLTNVEALMVSLTTSVAAVIKEIVSMVIGLVASIYILASKENFLGQMKKLIVGVFRPVTADRILHLGQETHRIFSGFIIAKLIDSLIIGILCYIGMRIFSLPFPMLIATIVGITNVIPFFGPIIGAAPSTILILFVDPLKAFYFVIFVLVLQQLDGNIIGPRIMGDTIGISGFWVLISLTIAGNLFGFGGMLLGVPMFAVIYALGREALTKRLQKKKLPLDTEHYSTIQQVGDLTEASAEEKTEE